MRTLVVYATETGCAEALAYSTYLQLRRRSATVCVRTAAGLRPSMLTEYDRLVFVVSTAAYGEFPHTLQALAEALRAHSHAFAAAYTVFGLGDSRYPLFNYAARKLVALLENAGAQCFYRVAYGDDQHPLGHLGEYIAWISGLAELWPLPEAGQQPPTCFRLTVERIGGECNEVKIPIECLEGRIVSNDLLTSEDHFRPVRSVVIRFDGRYDPGDVCCLYPTGDVGEVELALRTLGHDPSDTVVIRSVSGDALEFNRDLELTRGGTYYLKSRTRGKLPFEGRPIKLRTLFAEFLSLNNVCTQWQMEVIAPFAAMDIHRDKLVEMASFTVEGCAQYNRYCKDERRSLLEVLCDFNSVRLPLEVLINIATPYYPRMYSIASIPATIGIARHSASPYDGTPGALSYAAFKRFVAERRRGTGLMELCVAQGRARAGRAAGDRSVNDRPRRARHQRTRALHLHRHRPRRRQAAARGPDREAGGGMAHPASAPGRQGPRARRVQAPAAGPSLPGGPPAAGPLVRRARGLLPAGGAQGVRAGRPRRVRRPRGAHFAARAGGRGGPVAPDAEAGAAAAPGPAGGARALRRPRRRPVRRVRAGGREDTVGHLGLATWAQLYEYCLYNLITTVRLPERRELRVHQHEVRRRPQVERLRVVAARSGGLRRAPAAQGGELRVAAQRHGRGVGVQVVVDHLEVLHAAAAQRVRAAGAPGLGQRVDERAVLGLLHQAVELGLQRLQRLERLHGHELGERREAPRAGHDQLVELHAGGLAQAVAGRGGAVLGLVGGEGLADDADHGAVEVDVQALLEPFLDRGHVILTVDHERLRRLGGLGGNGGVGRLLRCRGDRRTRFASSYRHLRRLLRLTLAPRRVAPPLQLGQLLLPLLLLVLPDLLGQVAPGVQHVEGELGPRLGLLLHHGRERGGGLLDLGRGADGALESLDHPVERLLDQDLVGQRKHLLQGVEQHQRVGRHAVLHGRRPDEPKELFVLHVEVDAVEEHGDGGHVALDHVEKGGGADGRRVAGNGGLHHGVVLGVQLLQ
ncbi:flavodoxin domain containing protein [Babesia caballi]|uniref:Flavodoxin domain containing protein n=1 Tax=Babesia caballi TaxID=5871 RepID=A0AAV4LTG2_BABCB|nr:flavodoxin domain containing protein [Babesia caballi]